MTFGSGQRDREVAVTSEASVVDLVVGAADLVVGAADLVVGVAMVVDLLQKMSQNGEQEYKKRCATWRVSLVE